MATKVTDPKYTKRALLYRKVFGSADGREVLEDMLKDLCFFNQEISQQAVYRRQFADSLLIKLGFHNPLVDDKSEFIENLFK